MQDVHEEIAQAQKAVDAANVAFRTARRRRAAARGNHLMFAAFNAAAELARDNLNAAEIALRKMYERKDSA